MAKWAAMGDPSPSGPPVVSERSGPLRWVFVGLGFTFVGLGAMGVVLPGLPTTPFMLLAAWMFSKSSARFHAWLWNHRIFGPYVRDWHRHRVIPLHAKVLSLSFMTFGLGLMLWRQSPLPLIGVTAAVCIGGAVFILRRPSRAPATPDRVGSQT